MHFIAFYADIVTLCIFFPSDTVRNLLLDVDPEGVSGRRRKRLKRRTYRTMGPLYTIHVDGYDKLKPYGFPIHGAICGLVCLMMFFGQYEHAIVFIFKYEIY